MTKTEWDLAKVAASPSILMNSSRVKQVATTKSLDITTDDKLSWNCHIEKITKKIVSGIGAMKRVRYFVPPSILHLIYQAVIELH